MSAFRLFFYCDTHTSGAMAGSPASVMEVGEILCYCCYYGIIVIIVIVVIIVIMVMFIHASIMLLLYASRVLLALLETEVRNLTKKIITSLD